MAGPPSGECRGHAQDPDPLLLLLVVQKWQLGSRSLYLVRRSPQPRMHALLLVSRAFLVPQLVKNPPAMWEPWVRPMGWEDPLEKGKATHSSFLAWRTPWTLVRGVAESGMSEQLSLSL